MYYVHILRSIFGPAQIYVGATADLKQRFTDHNSGKSRHTAKYVAWGIECYVGMPDKQRAYDFENYLKSHSGRAFAAKRLMRTLAIGNSAKPE
jgi:putative endonuclease